MSGTPPPAPPVQPAPQAAPPHPPGPKKSSPWVWVAVGCGVLLLLVVLALVGASLFIFKKGRELVKGSENNPAAAAAKVAAALNPDIEVVASDDQTGTVTIRHKKTGEVMTLDLKDLQKGRILFSREEGKKAQVESSPGDGAVRFSSGEGEVVFGGGVSLPPWVPVPTGAQLEGGLSAQTKGTEGGAAGFKTSMDTSEVLAFYDRELKAAGFSATVSQFEKDGSVRGGLLQGKHADGRSILVTVSKEGNQTRVGLVYEGSKR